MLEALLEHEEAPDSAVAVLERVNALEAHVKGDDILKGNGFKGVIIGDQFADLVVDSLWRNSFAVTHLVGELFVIAHRKPALAAVAGAAFEE